MLKVIKFFLSSIIVCFIELNLALEVEKSLNITNFEELVN